MDKSTRPAGMAGHLPTSGAVFQIQPPTAPGGTWTTTYLYQFTNSQVPLGQLVMDSSGALYGVTGSEFSPPPSTGTIYRIETQ